MRAILTRVSSACVTIDGEVVGKIGKGFLILLGVGPEDTEAECRLDIHLMGCPPRCVHGCGADLR